MSTITIQPFDGKFSQEIGAFIVTIQREEFNIPITLDDQPDLNAIATHYQRGNGNFWVASANNTLIGTIALMDAGSGIGIIRKMFVHTDWRGTSHRVAQQLFDHLLQWATKQKFTQLYLGTIDRLAAAQRFYEKNGFARIAIAALPEAVDAVKMKLDNVYYTREVSDAAHAA